MKARAQNDEFTQRKANLSRPRLPPDGHFGVQGSLSGAGFTWGDSSRVQRTMQLRSAISESPLVAAQRQRLNGLFGQTRGLGRSLPLRAAEALTLQRMAGNRSVSRLLRGQETRPASLPRESRSPAHLGTSATVQRVFDTSSMKGSKNEEMAEAAGTLESAIQGVSGNGAALYKLAVLRSGWYKNVNYNIRFIETKPFTLIGAKGELGKGLTLLTYGTEKEGSIGDEAQVKEIDLKRVQEEGLQHVILLDPAHIRTLGEILATCVHEYGVHAAPNYPYLKDVFIAKSGEEMQEALTAIHKARTELDKLHGDLQHHQLGEGKSEDYNLLAERVESLLYSYLPWAKNITYHGFMKAKKEDIELHSQLYPDPEKVKKEMKELGEKVDALMESAKSLFGSGKK